MERVPRVNNKKLVKRKKLNKSQAIFIKYLEQYELFDHVKKLRQKLRIHDYGFTDSYQVVMWSSREGQEKVFNNHCLKFLVNHELPNTFFDLLKDYTLTGFSFDFHVLSQNHTLISIEEPKDINQAPHFILKVYEGTTVQDIQRFFKLKENKEAIKNILAKQKRIKIPHRLKSPSLHARYIIVKDYKKFTKNELLEKFWADPIERGDLSKGRGVDKNTIIQRLLKKRHDVSMSVENIKKI